VLFYPLDPGLIFSGSRIFLTITKSLLIKAYEARKKFAFHVSCRIWDEKFFGSGSGIKHPGSGTKHPGSGTPVHIQSWI
jgi:hypothetical protein